MPHLRLTSASSADQVRSGKRPSSMAATMQSVWFLAPCRPARDSADMKALASDKSARIAKVAVVTDLDGVGTFLMSSVIAEALWRFQVA